MESNNKEEIDKLLKSKPHEEKGKACLFNLIVYTHTPRRTEYLKEIVKLIVRQFPCRIIFLQCNPNSKEDHLTIHSSTSKATEECPISCDQIFITASGKEINKVNFILLPLFVPDLPIYLLWGEDPTAEYTILPHLQRFAMKLIIDSEATEDLQVYGWDIQNRMQSSSIQIVDMNWARIGGWREVIAHIFDSHERFNQLTHVQTIEIFYNDRPNDLFLHPNIQAIYLQAWLSSRLGWEYLKSEKGNHSQILSYKAGESIRQIKLSPKNDTNFQAEEILEIHFMGPDYQCDLIRTSLDQIQVHASNQSQCLLPFMMIMPTLKSGRSFMQEIFFQKVSKHYKPCLKLISLVKWN